jgi:8-oxo-dGTP pyrophosphatase MutT (NUDIX family)
MSRLLDKICCTLPIRSVRQCGALPYRLGSHGRPELLLITTRGGTRWLPPKGWPSWWRSDRGSAALEAYEEAGVRGDIETQPFGDFLHRKSLAPDRFLTCRIELYLLRVREQLDEWPEQYERQRRWFSIEAACSAVDNASLRDLIVAVAGSRLSAQRVDLDQAA